MLQNTYSKKLILALLALALAIASFAILVPRASGQDNLSGLEEQTSLADRIMGHRTIAVDVAEDGNRFSPDEAPVFDDGLPAYGAAFVTQGYLYPAGTLEGSEHGGVNEDGSPEFPDMVIGEWTCWGHHVGEGAYTESGPWVVSTQLFSFGENDGNVTIITDGYEMTANDESQGAFNRAITGGTGRYRNARGEQTQTFLGWNDSVGVQLSVELETR